MRKKAFVLLAGLLAWTCAAEPVCVDGMCYPDEASARAAGVPEAKIAAARASGAHDDAPGQGLSDLKNLLHATDAPVAQGPEGESAVRVRTRRRLAFGYMDSATFTAFLSGTPTAADMLGNASVAMVFLLVLLGGLLMNLTPCVLPLVPVSLVLVGRGGARGVAYGLGMMLAYGALGLAAAFGGLAFGGIQASPWFNLVVALVFLVLGLATSEVFFIDFSRFRPRPAAGGGVVPPRGLLGPFFLGTGTAVLAGACVAPILLATLVLTAKWFAAGRVWAVALPFVLGAGMGLPWPFITAGLSVLPKPGAWMKWVNRAFAVMLFGMAAWYGWLAWKGFSVQDGAEVAANTANVIEGSDDADDQRPRLVIVGAPWCKNCTAMERTTLKEPSVVEALARFNVKHVEINTFADFANYPELAGLDIKGVPAYVVIERKTLEETKTEEDKK